MLRDWTSLGIEVQQASLHNQMQTGEFRLTVSRLRLYMMDVPTNRPFNLYAASGTLHVPLALSQPLFFFFFGASELNTLI
jgi:hypothetical protein